MPRRARPRLAIISSQAFSLHNFRGPLIQAFVRGGVDVFALAPDYDETSRAAVRAVGAEPVDYPISRAGMNPVKDLIDTVGLTRRLRDIAPDFALGYFIKPVIYGTLAAKMAGVPRRFGLVPGLGYLFSIDDVGSSLKRRLMRGIGARLYAAAFSACERVVFQNEDDAAWFVSRGLLAREKVVRTNGTGVDLQEWRPVPLPDGPLVFLLIARLLPEKGIPEYAEAARLIRRKHPEARFLLVGGLDPNPSGLSREKVEAWAREGSIEWAGQTNDVRPWIAKAHVYVLPSYYREGVPRSTQEAMAMGRPVITTDSIGCRETVIHGRNGFLVPPRNVTALAEAMERFINDRGLIVRMGQDSRRFVEERFDVHQNNATILGAMGLPVT